MYNFNFIDVVYILLGAVVTFLILRNVVAYSIKDAVRSAHEIKEIARKEAELESRQRVAESELLLERKKSDLEKDLNARKRELDEWEIRIDKQTRELRLDRGSLKRRELELVERRQSVEQAQFEYRKRLEKIAEMSKANAIEALKQELRAECSEEIAQMKNEMLGESQEKIREEARRVVVDAIQRFSTSATSEMSATIIKLPNEEMKGRLIGREGRNIHSFEAATGTTLMIDDTPGSVLVSSFDPVRREIAKIALEKLVADGRIHPGTIEEAVKAAEVEIKENVIKLGESAAASLKIRNLDSEITTLLGKLHFYLSNNQRTLEHSVETAYLCSIMASEIGLNPEIAKRAGLFHDIGKAVTHEYEGSHASVGAMILKSHGEVPFVVNAVAAHHDEVPMTSSYAVLVQVADTLSSTRPGARNETLDGYVKRIDSLEKMALSFSGVRDSYALRAGRELRVIVEPDAVTDVDAGSIARKIRQRIEEEYTFPGTIRVTVIREQRFSETAT